jgi:hypothetical protein
MPTMDEMEENNLFHRILYVGVSGAGKTGSLVSLVAAGYKIRMIDLDNGWGILRQYVKKECPDKIKNVSVISFRDHYKATPTGVAVDGAPKAFINTLNALDKWPDDDSDPSEWGEDTILVIDSLTWLSKAAYAWFDKLNPTLKDRRQVYHLAQSAIMDLLQNVTAENFHAHTIVCTHLRFNDTETKAYASAIGKAIGPQIPSLFNNFVMAESKAGSNPRRVIKTVTDGRVDLKNEKPFEVAQELPLESGLATLFEQLKGN